MNWRRGKFVACLCFEVMLLGIGNTFTEIFLLSSRGRSPKRRLALDKENGGLALCTVLPYQPFRRSGPAAAISWGFLREGNVPHVCPKAIQYNQEHTNQHVFLNSKTRMKTSKLLNGKQCFP